MKMKLAAGLMSIALIMSSSPAMAEELYMAGTYSAKAMGMGNVEVTITVDETGITDVELNLDEETPDIGQAAGISF